MGVYIKGMEMPKQCVSCKLWTMQIIGGKGYDICRAVDKVIKQPYGRQDFCPLVELPPHGRLIDADRLGLAMMDAANADQALAMVDDAPTVIEKEEI